MKTDGSDTFQLSSDGLMLLIGDSPYVDLFFHSIKVETDWP